MLSLPVLMQWCQEMRNRQYQEERDAEQRWQEWKLEREREEQKEKERAERIAIKRREWSVHLKQERILKERMEENRRIFENCDLSKKNRNRRDGRHRTLKSQTPSEKFKNKSRKEQLNKWQR